MPAQPEQSRRFAVAHVTLAQVTAAMLLLSSLVVLALRPRGHWPAR